MAQYTDFLNLILPDLSEYKDTWHKPVNENFTKVTTYLQQVDTELQDARGNAESLHAYLAVGHDEDGNLKATPEVVAARNSPVYGDKFGTTDQTLGQRVNNVDWEVWKTREQAASLLDALAARETGPNMIVSGPKNANGYPTWLIAGDKKVAADGSSTPVVCQIGGYRARVRSLTWVDVPGTAALYYLVASRSDDGSIVVDGNSSNTGPGSGQPPVSPAGITSFESSTDPARLFSDPTVLDWTTKDVKAGDILQIVDGVEKGTYVIQEIVTDDPSKLKIIGHFPVGGVSNLNYVIIDPIGVTLTLEENEPSDSSKLCIGEVSVDSGKNVTEVRARHFKDTFVGEWQSVSVAGAANIFEKIWNHRLGSDVLEVSVQVSQANDGSAAVEELSLATIDLSALQLSLNKGTLAVTADKGSLAVDVDLAGVGVQTGLGTLATQSALASPNAHTHQMEGAPSASLSGTAGASVSGAPSATVDGAPAGSFSGQAVADRSIKCKWDKNRIFVKNIIPTVFYRDYSNALQTAGFIRVVVRKRG